MERYIGMDVHAASCTLAVVFEVGYYSPVQCRFLLIKTCSRTRIYL
jgi:hypothetical protein